jgi:DNA-binding NarL/FixJ family response regulator
MHAIPPRRIKAAVSHPSPLIVAGIIHTLSRDERIEAYQWDEDRHQEADVVITDYETALVMAPRFSKPQPSNYRAKVVVLAFTGRENEVRAALEAGVQGYLLSHCSQEELVNCVRMLFSGSRYLSEAAMKCVVDSLAREKLTPREVTVLALLAEGLGNKAIAKRLNIGLGTVKSHVVAILDKLDVSNRTQAAMVSLSRALPATRNLRTPRQPPLAASVDA